MRPAGKPHLTSTNDRPIPNIVHVKAMSLEDEMKGSAKISKRIAAKFVLDPTAGLTVLDQEFNRHDDNGKSAKNH
jgi:hypothetical protein